MGDGELKQLEIFSGRDTEGALGEAGSRSFEAVQKPMACLDTKSQTGFLMEEVVEPGNLKKALRRVRANRGAPGVDGMTVSELPGHFEANRTRLILSLLEGTYQPQSVRQVEIPKRGGGVRLLGIPTVLDRMIQQAILQVLEPIFDPGFSASSYGFRPGKSAHQAVAAAEGYIADGAGWVVDLDIEKFFDRVSHDILMGKLWKVIGDKRLLKLIRRYLQAGIMRQGVAVSREEGTPQGGPLSPLLSNIYLDELDKELERRGLRFCRYADDVNIHVGSKRSGGRVMESITRFLTKKLRLKVNREKSEVTRAGQGKILGFSFWFHKGAVKVRMSWKSRDRLKEKIREITQRSRGVSLERVIHELNVYLRGWMGYFRLVETPFILRDLDSWIRRRLRCFQWKQWKRPRTKYRKLRSMGLPEEPARMAFTSRGAWRVSKMLGLVMTRNYFEKRGLMSLTAWHQRFRMAS